MTTTEAEAKTDLPSLGEFLSLGDAFSCDLHNVSLEELSRLQKAGKIAGVQVWDEPHGQYLSATILCREGKLTIYTRPVKP